MKILITGATGLVGTKLVEKLMLDGHTDIRVLSRNIEKVKKNIPFPVDAYFWNPDEMKIQDGALEGVDIVFHLAGENIADGRWNSHKKDRILKSRVMSSRLLIDTIEKLETPPKKFIASSAIGIYGNRHDEILETHSSYGDDFIAKVCLAWEEQVHSKKIDGMRTHSLRTGIVLSEAGGALKKMLPPFLLGAGGRLGNGKQFMSWIHIDDLINMFLYVMDNDCHQDVYNAVAPNPVSNNEFTKILGRVLKRPTIFPVPGFVLRLIFSQMADILLHGQRVIPSKIVKEGFKFKYPHLDRALYNILQHSRSGELVLKHYQWINRPVKNVFEFFSNENNLEKITPPHLNFKVVGKNTDKIDKGTQIDYKLRFRGVPMKWKSQISNFENERSFTDIQLNGPYSKWEHQHDFIPLGNGTLIRDHVVYKLPLGLLGLLTAGFFVSRDVNNIFKYRTKVIEENFQS